jgi:integrase
MSVTTTTTRSRIVTYTKPDGTKAKRKAPGKRIRKKLTEETVKVLPTKRKQYIVWHTGQSGLHVLVSPGGARTYRSLWYYKGSTKPYARKLGRVGEITLEEAEELCRKDQRAAGQGKNPARMKSNAGTFEAVVNEYVDRYLIAQKEREYPEETRRILLKECDEWKLRPISSIRDDEIEDLLAFVRDGDGKKQRGRPHLAVKLWAHLAALFNWCARKKKLADNPMVGVERPWEGAEPRKRVFSDDELRKLWTCDTRTIVADNKATIKLGQIESAFLKMLILTGKRRGQFMESQRKRGLSSMRWGQIKKTTIELEDGKKVEIEVWEPPLGVRNKLMHAIPLPKLAQRILLGIKPKDAKPEDFVFPNPKTQEGDGINNNLYDRVRRLSGVKDFKPHALRHTVETGMAKIRIKQHMRDMLLDHSSKRGSGKDYDHHEYLEEMLEALEKWANHIEEVVMPEGVSALR